MILVDEARRRREAEGRPIRVGMFGAGFVGTAIARQLARVPAGIRLSAIAARRPAQALQAYRAAGLGEAAVVAGAGALEDRVAAGLTSVVEDATLLAAAPSIDVFLDVTGAVDGAAGPALAAIAARKHVLLMNAELDGTIGPLLKRRADAAGVIYSNTDGDQPGVTMNLVRFVGGIGVRPILCGNIKGLFDPYRTPRTQRAFAGRWGQKPAMVTSFADGTKIAFEQAVIANATGMGVARRGMTGPTVAEGTPVASAIHLLPLHGAAAGRGFVDYIVGAAPAPGVFVVGTIDEPEARRKLALYKLGEGPFYCFETPFHLCEFEVPTTIARASIFADATVAPAGAPTVSVVTVAKRSLPAGTVLDGIGGYDAYGVAENADAAARERLLPMGVSEGCTLRRAVARDQAIARDDVDLPAGRLIDRLLAEQAAAFAGGAPLAAA
ncbi:MAG: NAD(P)H-dependent oxidoreductase [Alphaproteobacteria bacterium]